ncbi:alpha-(1,3)-fucosyltransferase C-like [Dermacentor albipictus]|uniref:alpha-(1,3)-fucosyltransferase C-like n=1 Tax=Dermacentor albipictus TaxID=60249 RepID=UPI0031FDBF0B
MLDSSMRVPSRCLLALLVGAVLAGLYVLLPGSRSSARPSSAVRRRQPAAADPPVILMWTPFFRNRVWSTELKPSACGGEPACVRTSNRSALSASALVVFHLRDVRANDLPTERPRGQRWALFTHESPAYESRLPDALRSAINWTATYRSDSDINVLPWLQKVAQPPLPRNWWANKTRQALWLVSNCKTFSNREGFVRELAKFVQVDVVGDCGAKGGASCLPKMAERCYRQASKTYYFYLSLENSICTDYVTEKFFNALNWGMVPVVLGGANYSRIAPPGSYIDALAFRNVRQLADHMKRVAADVRLYNSYHAWRQNYSYAWEDFGCGFCRMLHNSSAPVKAYSDFNEWWFKQAHCYTWKKTFRY